MSNISKELTAVDDKEVLISDMSQKVASEDGVISSSDDLCISGSASAIKRENSSANARPGIFLKERTESAIRSRHRNNGSCSSSVKTSFVAPDKRDNPHESGDPNELEDPMMFCNAIATSRPQSDKVGDAL